MGITLGTSASGKFHHRVVLSGPTCARHNAEAQVRTYSVRNLRSGDECCGTGGITRRLLSIRTRDVDLPSGRCGAGRASERSLAVGSFGIRVWGGVGQQLLSLNQSLTFEGPTAMAHAPLLRDTTRDIIAAAPSEGSKSGKPLRWNASDLRS